MERSVSVSSDRNIRDHLWRWSTYFGWNIPNEIRRSIFNKPVLCPKKVSKVARAILIGWPGLIGKYRSIFLRYFHISLTGRFGIMESTPAWSLTCLGSTSYQALVLSRLDYSNSLLYGATRSDLDKLQRTMNSAARLITGIKKCEHISDALRNLHWLPIECRIKFKILLTVYKSLNGLAPDYLSALIDVRRPTRSLRSSDKLLLNVPKINTVTYGQRAFSYVAATLWNSIPDNIRNSVTVEIFKTRLKTFLFKEAYNSSN